MNPCVLRAGGISMNSFNMSGYRNIGIRVDMDSYTCGMFPSFVR